MDSQNRGPISIMDVKNWMHRKETLKNEYGSRVWLLLLPWYNLRRVLPTNHAEREIRKATKLERNVSPGCVM